MFETHQGTHILQSLDGFAFALGVDGRFLYISETVSIYLGLSQVEMTGSSVFDYTHQQDHVELAEQLGLSQVSSSGMHHHHSTSPLPPASVSSSASNESESGSHYANGNGQITMNGANDTMERQFCIRMKSTLTKRGCQHFKSSGYRVVHIVAHLRQEMIRRQATTQLNTKIIGLVAIAIALPPPSINELRLEPDMFVTRHSLDLKILHCEQRVTDLISYTPEELVGRSMYTLIHGQDVVLLKKCHQDLIHKGQAMSGYYRVINKLGGYTWMQTCATLICSSNSPANVNNTNNSKANANQTVNANNPTSSSGTSTPSLQDDQDQSVICVNYVLSAVEYKALIMDCSQLGQKLLNHSPLNRSSSPAVKMRTHHIKKSHSSTPSPEMVVPKMASNHGHPPPSDGSHHAQNSPQTHSANISRNRVTHSASPLEQRAENIKRRRLNSSPVRPWKSPSPPPPVSSAESNVNATGSNLLRHISVIRETPPILKPQVMAPSPYHAHHYHHLVDQYAAAYHLYKSSPNGAPISPQSGHNTTPHSAHHWGAYG
ncbi:hypothetical protein RDWZM_008115 [Blomia tropicalis]|uniref:PAS domain-containing protein n=1 Tax=Blomia tropicalis TaxID=40697 RepID=A0A9Q0M1I0_BLOTA|nr:hypothetical protein RDWZM_008115 [Blomia tropicalis]